MRRFIIGFAISMLFIYGCTKVQDKANLSTAGIAFTFDDYSVNEWYKCLPLFDSFGVKATFFISNYKKLSPDDIAKLTVLKQHGHEIAHHTTNHYNMVNYLNNEGMQKLLENEITKGLKAMKKDHFYPTTFAYPFGQHNLVLNNALLKYFKSVRALNATPNTAKSVVATSNNEVLYGLGIDESGKRPLSVVLKLVHTTSENNKCLVLVSHHIDKPETRLKTSLPVLRAIIKEAAVLGMHFYTVAEISK